MEKGGVSTPLKRKEGLVLSVKRREGEKRLGDEDRNRKKVLSRLQKVYLTY